MIYILSYLAVGALAFHLFLKYIMKKYPHSSICTEDIMIAVLIATCWPILVPLIFLMEMLSSGLDILITKFNNIYKKK